MSVFKQTRNMNTTTLRSPHLSQTREASRAEAACPAVSVGFGCSSLGLWSRATEKVGRWKQQLDMHTLEPGTPFSCCGLFLWRSYYMYESVVNCKVMFINFGHY